MSNLTTLSSKHKYADATEITKGNAAYVKYGANNDYPDYLIDLYQKSSVHNALCNSIANWVYGNGVTSSEKAEKPEFWAKYLSLFDEDTVKRMSLDLKVQGGFYIEISYSLDRSTVSAVKHIPYQNIRVEKENDDDEVDFYYYCKDWKNERKLGKEKIKAFDPKQKKLYPTQLLGFSIYSVGSKYYAKPDYQGGINYIELDKNVSEFHLSNIKNGLAPSFLLSFNQGIPEEEKRRKIKRKIESELGGAKNAGKFILSFSDDRANAPELTPFPLSDADKQYQFLSEEITRKVMVSHRVVSPRLFGVNSDGAGLGNNADELRTASLLFEETVVKGYRKVLEEAFTVVMSEAGTPIKLEFENANPFIVEEEKVVESPAAEDVTSEEIEQVDASYNGAQISSAIDIVAKVKEGILNEEQAIAFLIQFLQMPDNIARSFFKKNELNLAIQKKKVKQELTDEDAEEWLKYLDSVGGRVDTNEWELVEEVEVEDLEEEAKLNGKPYKFFKRYAEPDEKSKVDKGLYKIRYRYSTNLSKNSRLFCKNMVANAKLGVSYRYEDIQQMSKDGINSDFAPSGKNKYSIWEFKGGVYCHHKWLRQVWKRKRLKGKFLPNKGLENDEIVSPNTRGTGITNPRGYRKASTRTIDQPNRGSLKHK